MTAAGMQRSDRLKPWLILACTLVTGYVPGNLHADCTKLSPALQQIVDEHLEKYRNAPHCAHIYHKQQVEMVLYYVDGACLVPGQSEIVCEKRTLAFIAGHAPDTVLPPLQIGASNDFLPREITLDGNTVELRGSSYADGDPPCCPSQPDERRVRLTRSGFILIAP